MYSTKKKLKVPLAILYLINTINLNVIDIVGFLKSSFFYRQGYYDGYYDYYPQQLSYAQRVKSVENRISGRLLGGLRGTLNNARKVSSRYVCDTICLYINVSSVVEF